MGSSFSVVAIAEGARDHADSMEMAAAESLVKEASSTEAVVLAKRHKEQIEAKHRDSAFKLASELGAATGHVAG